MKKKFTIEIIDGQIKCTQDGISVAEAMGYMLQTAMASVMRHVLNEDKDSKNVKSNPAGDSPASFRWCSDCQAYQCRSRGSVRGCVPNCTAGDV